VDTILSGAALFRSGDNAKLQEFVVPRKKKEAFMKQVAFAESDKVIISGSDHGSVYVFDRKSGSLLEVLDTGNACWMQSVTVSFCIHFSGRMLILPFRRRTLTEHPQSLQGRPSLEKQTTIFLSSKELELAGEQPPYWVKSVLAWQ
jgi:hypothetical protein